MRPTDRSAIREFESYLSDERALSPHTLRAYRREVEWLAESPECDRAGSLDALEALAVRSYLASFHGRHRPSTRNRRLAALRAFFRFRVRRGRMTCDPTEGLPGPRAEHRLPAPGWLHRRCRVVPGPWR